MANTKYTAATMMRASTAPAVTADHCQFLSIIFITAQSANRGERTRIGRPVTTRLCTCNTSLVERVIRLEIEKSFSSGMV